MEVELKDFKIIHMDGYDELRDADTGDTIFSTILDDSLSKSLGRHRMADRVVEQVVRLWNKTGKAVDNLWSGGIVDEYLLDEGRCSKEEREIIVEALYQHATKH